MTAPHGAVGAAREFLEAVIWGSHSKLWPLFSSEGRDRILLAGNKRGLDSVLAERIRQGTASQAEMDDFLSGLVRGFRVDLSAADLDDIEAANEVVPVTDDQVRVLLQTPAPFHSDSWPAGSLVISNHGDAWLIDWLEPRRVKQ